jgi:hypothetical protein
VDERVSPAAPFDKNGALAELVALNQFDVVVGQAALAPDGEVIVSLYERSRPDSKCRKLNVLQNPDFHTQMDSTVAMNKHRAPCKSSVTPVLPPIVAQLMVPATPRPGLEETGDFRARSPVFLGVWGGSRAAFPPPPRFPPFEQDRN